MWHPLSFVAHSRRLNLDRFIRFAMQNVDKYHIAVNDADELEVNTWNVDSLVKDFKSVLTEADQHFRVHTTHCCPGHCKYGEVDVCPVAQYTVDPEYKCEDCKCLTMNPDALDKAEKWWNDLNDATKVYLYLDRNE